MGSRSISMWAALVMSAAVVVMGPLLVGCDGLGGGDETTVSSTGTTGAVPGGPTTTASVSTTALPTTTTVAPPSTPSTVSATEEEVLPSGNIKCLGYIKAVWVDGGTRYIRIDYAQMLTGADADAAAIAAGEILPGEHVPNDYKIVNESSTKYEFSVSNSVAITTETRGVPHAGSGASCTWADFMSFWSSGPLPVGDSHMHDMPWWIERDVEGVVKIWEQYIP